MLERCQSFEPCIRADRDGVVVGAFLRAPLARDPRHDRFGGHWSFASIDGGPGWRRPPGEQEAITRRRNKRSGTWAVSVEGLEKRERAPRVVG
jgi:hypothetical protein